MQTKIIERIIHEIICVYDFGTNEMAADILTDLIKDKMLDKLVDFLD